MSEVERATNGRWLPGQSANPAGRPRGTGSGVILAEHVKRDTLEEWQRRGKAALEDLTSWQFVQWCGTILPKELLLAATVEPSPLEGLSADEMRALLQTVRVMRARLIEQPSAACATPQLPRDESIGRDAS